MYGKLGANVVVNDMSKENADSVVAEIKKGKSLRLISPFAETDISLSRLAGGKAAAVVCSTEEGEKLVKSAIEHFGSLHSTLISSLSHYLYFHV